MGSESAGTARGMYSSSDMVVGIKREGGIERHGQRQQLLNHPGSESSAVQTLVPAPKLRQTLLFPATMKSACFAAAAALVEVVAGLNVYHRVWDPSQSQSQSSPPFTLRGTLEGNPLSLTLADTLISNPDSLDSSLYQIALEREGDASSDDWDLSSVKAVSLDSRLAPLTR